MKIHLEPIGIVHSCFKERFGIPRQAGLAPDAEGILELLAPWDRDEAVRGLEEFSHLWLLFLFHKGLGKAWKPTVRPPRLGGKRRVGVFASRSPLRPNPLGLSAVELKGIRRQQGRLLLQLGGVDLLDGTPVVDIKPYLPFTDSLPEARGGFAEGVAGPRLSVGFSPEVEGLLDSLEAAERARLTALLTQTLEQDPRPAYLVNHPQRTTFHLRLQGWDVRWRVAGGQASVLAIQPAAP